VDLNAKIKGSQVSTIPDTCGNIHDTRDTIHSTSRPHCTASGSHDYGKIWQKTVAAGFSQPSLLKCHTLQ